MTITDTQLAVLIFKNGAWGPGGSRDKVIAFLDDAYAVMMAESGGNPAAKNPDSSASGLFQIMVSAHRDKIDKAVRKLGGDIFNPDVNVEVARMVWNEAGKSWSPWEAYNKKTATYKANKGHGEAMYTYLDTMTQAQLGQAYSEIASMVNPPLVAALNFKEDPWGVIGGFLKDAGVTVGVFLLGVIVLIAGLWLIISNTKVGKTAVGVATKGAV